MDEILYRYKWLIGGGLIVIILAGFGVSWWDKAKQAKVASESKEITELKAQNESLRAELSSLSRGAVAGTSSEENTDKININTATAEELDKLPNIGPARAADIISYRETNGGFKTIEEIKNIKGIGDKSFEELKNLITVGG